MNYKKDNLIKINKESEIKRFLKMNEDFERIENIRKTLDEITYLLPSEREKIENILFDIQIRTLRNLEWQRKILDLPKSLIGDIEELIKNTEELRKRTIQNIKEGRIKSKNE